MSLRARPIALLSVFAGMSALVAAGCGSGDSGGGGNSAGGSGGGGAKKYVIGVSNTVVGNGWREEMICSIKAQSLASGNVSKVLVSNQNGGPTEQIAAIHNLISSGANAIIINPADANALNGVIADAKKRGVVVVSVDQAVSSHDAYIVTNDQVKYGKIGMEALAKKIGGKGNVVELRGGSGAPADTDRHNGVMQALKQYPNVKVVKQVFTDWQFGNAGKAAVNILQSGQKVDGFWTSGQDYTVVNAFKTTNKPPVPVVGSDTNEFLNQMLNLKGFDGIGVTNPATIGGVGTRIALEALTGKKPPRVTKLNPVVWDKANESSWKSFYDPSLPPTYSSQQTVKPYTTYTPDQLKSCQGP